MAGAVIDRHNVNRRARKARATRAREEHHRAIDVSGSHAVQDARKRRDMP